MTPLQAAKAECANCDGAGNCAGVGIKDDLSPYRFRDEGKCWLLPDERGKIKQCEYFDACVIPLAKSRTEEASTQEQKHAAQSLAQGVHLYELAVMPVPTAKHAKCESCQQRVLRPARFCPTCAKRRKLQSNNRLRMRKNEPFGALIASNL